MKINAQISKSGLHHIDDWDEYFYIQALAAAMKSKDPKCQVGAVVVSDKQVISAGFNGLARGVFDSEVILNDGRDDGEKLKLICHAETNAISNAARRGVAVIQSTLYVTKFPCLACCNAIIQAGIKRIYTQDNKYWDADPLDGTDRGNHAGKKEILKQARIIVDAPFHPDFQFHPAFHPRTRLQLKIERVDSSDGAATPRKGRPQVAGNGSNGD